MSAEMIRRELEIFWQKLCYFFGLFLDFARQVVEDPSMVARGDLVMMAATLLIVVLFLLGGLIRFLTEPWKKKWESLVGTLLVLLVLAVIAFIVLKKVSIP
ncbi:MAG: hypothetical protein IJQ43_08030 [Oscillospiraceae bacterium]|nr:hypothetical protein [Oscillospiraceae bacterium]MBR0208829.1 hypothetical protein [Oscillospiraceae bacterium]